MTSFAFTTSCVLTIGNGIVRTIAGSWKSIYFCGCKVPNYGYQ